jgi:methylase of polypeptide subunit release factors
MRAWWRTGARARTSGTGSSLEARCCPAARLLQQAPEEIPEAQHDQAALELVLRKRQDKTRAFFDDMAGRLGREYVPGRSWKSIAEALLQLLPPMVIADLGAGEGAFSLLLAQRAQQVIAVDNSDRMVELGSALARSRGSRRWSIARETWKRCRLRMARWTWRCSASPCTTHSIPSARSRKRGAF